MASKSNSSDAKAGPSAFGIKLGISTGGSSPDQDADRYTVMVNADTTVNWIFLQAAYNLSHIHGGKSGAALQEDFDVVMLRPDRGDIVLNPSRVIADYQVAKNDVFELRHKTRPIPVCVNLSEGGDFKIEVNSGFPVMDVIPSICQEIGIRNHTELSLALPSSGADGSTMIYEWLDVGCSLHGQGIQHGDTLLLRKKFFILNDDVSEAVEGNDVLLDLIYQQVRAMFTTGSYTGARKSNMEVCSKMCAFLHHIEQKDENISDEESLSRVMPKALQRNADFYSQTVMVYFQERIGTYEVEDAKKQILKLLSMQTVLINYFPVKKFDRELHPEELLLVVDSNTIRVGQMMGGGSEMKCVDGMDWRLRDLREAECTSEKDHYLRLNILGSWFEFMTDHRTQISRYLLEARVLTQERVKRNRVSVANVNSDRLSTSIDVSTEVESSGSEGHQSTTELNHSMSGSSVDVESTPVDVESKPIDVESKPVDVESKPVDVESKPVDEPQVSDPATEDTKVVTSEENEVEPEVKKELESSGKSASSVGMESIPEEAEQEVEEEVKSSSVPMEVNVEVKSATSQQEMREEAEQQQRDRREKSASTSVGMVTDESIDLDDINSALDNVSGGSESLGSLTLSPVCPPPHEIDSLPRLANGGSKSKEVEAMTELPSPTKSSGTRTSVSSYVHIPEFVGLDFREVLENYKLFQVVVMKKDVRSILLNIKKPVREVLSSLCKTFDMPDTGACYLWIPTGIQRIIEKYGGRPRSRIGRFVKRHQVGGDFTPRLDTNKSLEEQYNFNIKPYLLHIRRYQSGEDVDAPEDSEIDCGREWPDCANPDVPRYRKFYQSWTGVVQGIYPIERKGAVRLAALLTQIYYGDREKSTVWPPFDYDAKTFLPETHKQRFGISSEVEKAHRELSGTFTVQECINRVVEGCERLSTMRGVFFEVSEPIKSDIMKVIPWNKLEGRWFGISINGIFSIDKETEGVNFQSDLTEISKWSFTESSFKLTLRGREFDAYTYQAKEILDTLELFIQMRLRHEESIAPEKPSSLGFTTPTCTSPASESSNGYTQKLTPLNLENERKQSILSPTTYDL